MTLSTMLHNSCTFRLPSSDTQGLSVLFCLALNLVLIKANEEEPIVVLVFGSQVHFNSATSAGFFLFLPHRLEELLRIISGWPPHVCHWMYKYGENVDKYVDASFAKLRKTPCHIHGGGFGPRWKFYCRRLSPHSAYLSQQQELHSHVCLFPNKLASLKAMLVWNYDPPSVA